MKIGIIATPWVPIPPPAYGGAETVIDAQARGFQAAGHEVLLFTTGDSTCPVPRGHILESADRIDIGMGQYELQHVIHAYQEMANAGVDIIHDHTLAGLLMADRYPNIPVVTTNHGPFGPPLGALYQAVSPPITVIAISHDQALRADKGIQVSGVIHHGLDAQDFPVGSGKGNEDGEYFLFLGRMSPEKGVVEAVLAAREANVRLLIAAKMREEAEREYFFREVHPLLNDDIVYIGEVDRHDRDNLLANASALVNPIPHTRQEPFGMVMIEALACGTPVIASRHSTAPEIVQQGVTGFLCEDTGDFVTAFGQVDTIDRADCRSSVEGHFSSRRMVDEHLALFEKILSEKILHDVPNRR